MAAIEKVLQYVDIPSVVLLLLAFGVCALGVAYARAKSAGAPASRKRHERRS